MAAGNFSGQKRREIVFPQDRVDVVDIADSVLKRNDKGRVAGYPPQKRSHPVQDQRLLRLVQPELCRQTEPQDHVALRRVLFLGDELVAIALGEVGGEKDLLLQDALLLKLCAHVRRPRPLAPDQLPLPPLEEGRELRRGNPQQFFLKFVLPVSDFFCQDVHPFYS